MKRFLFGSILIAIATRWWLSIPMLAAIGGLLGFLKQAGSMPASWNQVVVSAVWGAGLGFLFVVGGAKPTRRFVIPVLSALVMLVTTVLTGLLLNWSLRQTIAVGLGAVVLGLIAGKWATHINLI